MDTRVARETNLERDFSIPHTHATSSQLDTTRTMTESYYHISLNRSAASLLWCPVPQALIATA